MKNPGVLTQTQLVPDCPFALLPQRNVPLIVQGWSEVGAQLPWSGSNGVGFLRSAVLAATVCVADAAADRGFAPLAGPLERVTTGTIPAVTRLATSKARAPVSHRSLHLNA